MKVHLNDWFKDLYHQFPGEKFIGIYTFHTPVMVVNDPEMARQILIKDFNHFVDRDTEANMSNAFPGKTTDVYWLGQMTIKTGDQWKDIRSTFSPIFTSGKMKAMMRFIDKVSDSLVGHMDKNTALTDGFELKDTMGKFSLDTLASCAFGVDGQSFEDKESVFVNSPGIHSDPEYFPNPSVFNPDNFSKEAKASRSPYTFLGFGQGPRACIGMRFAMLETKVALLKVFRQFSFKRVERTVEQATTDPGSQLGYAKEGLYVRVVRRTEE